MTRVMCRTVHMQMFDLDHLASRYSLITFAQAKAAGWKGNANAMVLFKNKDYKEVRVFVRFVIQCYTVGTSGGTRKARGNRWSRNKRGHSGRPPGPKARAGRA